VVLVLLTPRDIKEIAAVVMVMTKGFPGSIHGLASLGLETHYAAMMFHCTEKHMSHSIGTENLPGHVLFNRRGTVRLVGNIKHLPIAVHHMLTSGPPTAAFVIGLGDLAYMLSTLLFKLHKGPNSKTR
jgi:hypothetical protein